MTENNDTCGHPTADGDPCQNPATDGDSCWIDAHGGDTTVQGRPRERPDKSTEETIASAIESGASIREACRRTGTHPEQFYRWMQYGEEEPESAFGAFREMMIDVFYSDFDRKEHHKNIMQEQYSGEDSWVWKEKTDSDYRGPNWKKQRKKA